MSEQTDREPWVPWEELARPERHLFLSPHYDDIALSCGGTAAALSLAGRSGEVAIIFGSEPNPNAPLTEFAATLHAAWRLSAAEVIDGRRQEEAEAALSLGTRPRFLPFRDAIYRGDRYRDHDTLFGTLAPEDADLPGRIVAALELPGQPDPATRLYAPLAIGKHVDHQLAFAAGLRLARAGWAVWFYEDLPYALWQGARLARLEAITEPLTLASVVEVTETWPAKLDAILAYASQLTTVFGYVESGSGRAEIDAVMGEYARAVGDGHLAERFWRLAE